MMWIVFGLIVLLTAALIVVRINPKFLRRIKQRFSDEFTQVVHGHESDDWDNEEEPQSGTVLLPVLLMDQLDPRTMKVVKTFKVHDIPSAGVTVSRPNALYGDIYLSDAVNAAYSVSEEHIRIGKDEKGMFIQDNGSSNKLRVLGQNDPVDEVPITDKLVVLLGLQPLCFRVPKPSDFFDGGRSLDDILNSAPTNYAPEEPAVCKRRKAI